MRKVTHAALVMMFCISAVLAPLVTTEVEAATTRPGYNGKIAYVDSDSTPAAAEIRMGTLATGENTLLESFDSHVKELQVSPDGSKLTYLRCTPYSTSTCKLYVSNADGKNEVELTPTAASRQRPQFSPDGNTIVFEQVTTSFYKIYTVGIDGSNLRALTTGSYSDFMPVFSPTAAKSHFILLVSLRTTAKSMS